MTQYVAQIEQDGPDSYSGALIKSFQVTQAAPVPEPEEIPECRRQISYTDAGLYQEVTNIYAQYDGDAVFTFHPESPEDAKITWEISE